MSARKPTLTPAEYAALEPLITKAALAAIRLSEAEKVYSAAARNEFTSSRSWVAASKYLEVAEGSVSRAGKALANAIAKSRGDK